jgi:hypothetical protein
MMIPLRRIVVRTFLALTLASSASGQARKLANTEGLRNETVLAQATLQPIPPEMTQRFQTLHSALQPSVNSWVQQQAQMVAQQSAPNLPVLEAAIRSRFSGARAAGPASPNAASGNFPMLGGLQGTDIEALAFIVMMQATQDMDQDLKNIMQDVQKHNQQKQALRQLLDGLNQAKSQGNSNSPCASPACQSLVGQIRQFSGTASQLPHPVRFPSTDRLTNGDVAQLQQQMQQNLDSLGDMSEMESLRLQMAMDRRSKFLETLSNVMKKLSDTSSSLISNLK